MGANHSLILIVFQSRGPPPWGWGASTSIQPLTGVCYQHDAAIERNIHVELYLY